jgi:hypothetical protein
VNTTSGICHEGPYYGILETVESVEFKPSHFSLHYDRRSNWCIFVFNEVHTVGICSKKRKAKWMDDLDLG